jgi:hypothetical protein
MMVGMKIGWIGSGLMLLAGGLVVVGCGGQVGQPTDQEIQQMQAWSEVVTPLDREQVTREANQHTDWLERRKVQFITGEYKRRYLHEQAHPTTRHASPSPASAPVETVNPGGL